MSFTKLKLLFNIIRRSWVYFSQLLRDLKNKLVSKLADSRKEEDLSTDNWIFFFSKNNKMNRVLLFNFFILLISGSLPLFNKFSLSNRRIHIVENYRILSSQEIAKLGLPFLEDHPDPMVIEDVNGHLFYVYKLDFSSGDWITFEKYEKEYRAYLLGKDIFNLAEIRVIYYQTVKGTPLGDWMEKNWKLDYPLVVSRLVGNYKLEELPYQKGSAVWLPVFYALINDIGDHLREDPRIGGKPRDLGIIKEGEVEHYISNDHDSGLQIFDDPLWDAEGFVEILLHPECRGIMHSTWVWVFDQRLDYKEMANLIFKVQYQLTDDNILNIMHLVEERLNISTRERVLENLIDNLKERRDTLRSVLEYLVYRKNREKINLFFSLEEIPKKFYRFYYNSLIREYVLIGKYQRDGKDKEFWTLQLEKIYSYLEKFSKALGISKESLFKDIEAFRTTIE